MTRVEVIEMAQHFLYLPFYYAKDKKFFGYVNGSYQVELEPAFPKTDEGALRQMLSGASDDVVRFAICDPSPLLDIGFDEDDPPAILAAIITNAAVWAVDKEADAVQTFEELKAFQKIIAFGKGTTTFGMARRLVGTANVDRILEVAPGQELNALMTHKSAVAFSPEILDAVSAIQKGDKFKIILPLGSTREYDNVLVTALVTKKSVVKEHPQLVSGMLAALQQAMVEVNLQSEEVKQFAMRRFQRSETLVSLALETAGDVAVFPPNILVQRNHWDAAVQSYCEGQGRAFDAEAKLKGYRLYDKLAKAYIGLAKQAMQSIVPRTMRGVAKDRNWFNNTTWISLGVFIGILAATIALLKLPTDMVAISGTFGLLALATAKIKAKHFSTLQLSLHAAAYLACAVCSYLMFHSTGFNQTLALAIVTIILGADYGVVLGGLSK